MARTFRTAALAALAGLALAGCSRDLELPADLGVPVVRSISPAAAWGGQWLKLTGSGFDPNPGANRVQFGPGGVATAERLEGGVLWVRVPGDAASGPVSVSNGRGTGAPFGAFAFRGRGELEHGQLVESHPLLHAPTGIVAAKTATGNTFFLQSSLWQGLVNLTDAAFDGDGATGGVSIDGGAAIAWIDRGASPPCPSPAPPPQIVRYDIVAKTHACVAAPAEPYVYLASLAGTPNRLAVVSTDQATVQVRILNAATLAEIAATRTVGGVADVDAAADAGGGRIVMVARQVASGPEGLLVAHSGGDTWLAAPAGVTLAGYRAHQPIAVARTTGGNRIAYAVELGGDLRGADLGLDGATGGFAFQATSITLNFTVGRPAGLAAEGKYVVVSKGGEGLVLGIDADANKVAWSVPQASPGPATGTGSGYFAVASEASNDALHIEAATGIAHARWDFGLFPGRQDEVAGSWVSRPGALAWCGPPLALCTNPVLVVTTSYPGGTLFRPTGATGTPSGYTQGETGGVAVTDTALWSWSEPTVAPGWVEAPTASVPLPDAVLRVLPDTTGAWVLHASGLSRIEGGAVVGTSAFPYAATAALQPVVRPDGRIVVAFYDGADWWAAMASRAQVLASTDAEAYTLPAEADLLLVSDEETWLVVSGPTASSGYVNEAYRLAWFTSSGGWWGYDELVELPTGRVWGTVAVSPNGRAVVRQTAGGLQLRRADPRADFPVLAEIPVDGVVTGVTFGYAGDTAWAITRAPEKVLTLQ